MRKKTGRRVYQKLTAAVALICALVGTLLGSMTAQADSIVPYDGPATGSITITKTDDDGNGLKGSRFTLYKIMDLTPGVNPGEFAEYSVVEYYESALDGITPNDLGNYSAAEIEAKVNELLPLTNYDTDSIVMSGTDENGKATIDGLDLGYYMVVETTTPKGYVAGAPFFIAIPSTNNYDNDKEGETPTLTVGTEWVYDVEFTPKNSEVPLDKEIKDGENWVSNKTAAVGDIVEYRVKTTIPDYADEYFKQGDEVVFRLTDTFSAGLSFQNDIKVYVYDDQDNATEVLSSDITWTLDLTTTGFVLTFKKDFIKEYRGAKIEVTYSAEVTEDAIIGINGNTNKVVLDFSNNPQNVCKYDSKDDGTKVYTFAIAVEKFAGSNYLANAEFALYSDAECTQQVLTNITTGLSGIITFNLVDAGTYYLKEIQAPEGYKLLTNPIKVEIIASLTNNEPNGGFTLKVNGETIDESTEALITRYVSDEGLATIAVENQEGFTLPKTGGMGIVALLIAGLGGIVILSIVMIKKRQKE